MEGRNEEVMPSPPDDGLQRQKEKLLFMAVQSTSLQNALAVIQEKDVEVSLFG